MKTSSTALLATMAAASTPVAATLRESGGNEKHSSNEVSASNSSTPGRQLDGKSGKATASASFPATPQDYAWIVGEYDPADLNLPIDYHYNQVLLHEGEPTVVHPAGLGMYYAAKLDIKPLRAYPSLVFQATLDIKFAESDLEFREVMEGVGSFNPSKVDEITFYSDHKELRNSPDEEWVPGLLTEYAELTTLECSKVSEYPHGENIVCEYYGNGVSGTPESETFNHLEGISTTAWTKQLLPMV